MLDDALWALALYTIGYFSAWLFYRKDGIKARMEKSKNEYKRGFLDGMQLGIKDGIRIGEGRAKNK